MALVLLGLTGCRGGAPKSLAATPPSPAQTPTLPPLVRVYRPPELEAWDEPLAACATAGPVLLAIESFDHSDGAWSLHWGDPPADQAPAYAVGKDGWALLLHADNPLARIPAEAWPTLWRDPSFTWALLDEKAASLPPPAPVVPPPDRALGRALRASVGGDVDVHPRARLAPAPAIAVRAVAQEPGALALVPRRWLTWAREAHPDLPWEAVRELIPPAVPDWQADVVLTAPHSPPDAAQRWVRCIQNLGEP